jgi:hypothetical protein
MSYAYDTDILLRGVIIESIPNIPISSLFRQRTAEDQKEMAACQQFFERELERTLLYSIKDEWKNNIRSKMEDFANEIYALRESNLSAEKMLEKLKQKTQHFGLIESFGRIATENWREEIDIFLSTLDRNYFILIQKSQPFDKNESKHEKWKTTFINDIPALNVKGKSQDLENLVACACLADNSKSKTVFVLIDKPLLKHKEKIEQTGNYNLMKPSEITAQH